MREERGRGKREENWTDTVAMETNSAVFFEEKSRMILTGKFERFLKQI